MKNTTTDLPQELSALAGKITSKSQKNSLAEIIKKAMAGEYDLQKSPHKDPKSILISHLGLLQPITNDLIASVKAGKFHS